MDFGISLDRLAVSQRHELDDSESEEEYEETNTQTLLESAASDSSEILTEKGLVLGIGNTASVFLRSFVSLTESPAVSLTAETVEKRRKNATFSDQDGRGPREIAPVELYELDASDGNDSKWIVCTQDREMRVEYCNRWTEKVLVQGKPSHALVYVCRPLHKYFSPLAINEDTTHILRILATSTCPPHAPSLGLALEPPNSVKAETASILTQCEVQGIPCLVVILYASSSLTESEKSLLLLPSLRSMANILPGGLQLRDEEEGEVMVKKLQSQKLTHFTSLYT